MTKPITDALAAPFHQNEVKFKPQVVKGNRAMALAYIDARTIEDRLDEVLGCAGWQDEYETMTDGSVVCRLRLKLEGEWVTKMDVGSPSEQPDGGDRMKAAFSDALKRAAVKFGIGRYLYRLPVMWAEYDPVKKQFTQTPQLPAFAQGGRAAAKPKTAAPALPQTGQELYERLKDYDGKLAAQKLCAVGALLTFVAAAGGEAGFGTDLTTWTGPAIPLAVAKVKEFDAQIRKPKTTSPPPPPPPTAPKLAAPSNLPASIPELIGRLTVFQETLVRENLCNLGDVFVEVDRIGKLRRFPDVIESWPASVIPAVSEEIRKWADGLRKDRATRSAGTSPPSTAKKPDDDGIGDRELQEIEADRRDQLQQALYEKAGEIGKGARDLIEAHRSAIGLLTGSETPKGFGKLTTPQLEALYKILCGLAESEPTDIPY